MLKIFDVSFYLMNRIFSLMKEGKNKNKFGLIKIRIYLNINFTIITFLWNIFNILIKCQRKRI